MNLLFVLLLLACVLAIQYLHADRSLKHIVYRSELDRELAEPDQVLTLSSTLGNTRRLPVFYLCLMEGLPDALRAEEDPAWCRRHVKELFSGRSCTSQIYLLPHRRYTRRLRFSLPDRGVYCFGKYYLATGDLLGFRTRNLDGKMEKRVVVMPRRWEDHRVEMALGGYLGEISVRRFLFEDPVLTIGVREYTGSEPLKQISWKQTARTGALQVKKYDYTVDANVTVLLNLDGGSPGDRECCFRIARTVCEVLEKRRIPYEFCGNGDLTGPLGEQNWFSEGLGTQHYRTLMYALGQSRGQALFPFSRLVDRCVKKRRRSRGYIVISPPLRRQDQEALHKLRRFSETEPCLLIGAEKKGGTAS